MLFNSRTYQIKYTTYGQKYTGKYQPVQKIADSNTIQYNAVQTNYVYFICLIHVGIYIHMYMFLEKRTKVRYYVFMRINK